ncbi:hypothetical protein [Roseobacter phage RDJL6]|nr:hypothetical protein [Roseobacter phage RDJL6]
MNTDNRDLLLEEILDEALTASHRAAHKAEKQAETWFPCGFAWVTIGGNEPLARHCREALDEADPEATSTRYGNKGYPKGWTWWCPGHRSTQRMETFQVGAAAFAAVLKKHGIDATVGSRMD